MRKITVVTALLFAGLLSAQEGTNVYPFLNIPGSARQAALGGDAVSVRDFDVSFAAINPGLMNLDQDQMISINYASYLADSQYGTISFVKDLEEGHLIGFNARYMDYGKMPRTDESAEINGNFGAMDASLGLAYAYQFDEDFTIGGGANFITSKIDNYTSMAVVGTAGVTYHNAQSRETLALVFRNFGYQFKSFNGTREDVAFRVDLGYTKILDEFPLAFTITAHDLQKLNISQNFDNNGQEVSWSRKMADHISLGAELFPEQAFNIRFGYNVRRGNELAVLDQRSFAGLSAGFGIKISSFRFDYAHVRYHNASNVNMFGLTLDLIEVSGNRR
ncbi:type IX secretion system protein PorQ [Kaistella flava (ex Peng et al. 2021)]|uniref:Type IX secretion system protein PorQ n=1 Tax=Kaistella flava (ex Peng et al. 2021) TaxID=2038776 RepID=A0A7M2Y810_9FLAO|nr:type IX secretion system protein PorQ [Kaistella flava (ex Peng et al. 2021)]QOW09483.1 type IX secretion system protein PorQ [Kaistella flava (ex Peng et al. 2021)]